MGKKRDEKGLKMEGEKVKKWREGDEKLPPNEDEIFSKYLKNIDP